MQHSKEIAVTNDTSRVPIEYPNKNFFTGKLLVLCYLVNADILYQHSCSEVRCPIQLNYKRV